MPIPILTLKDICAICAKSPSVALNRPHSLKKTKKLVRPNLGQWNKLSICAKCRKALSKPDRIKKVQQTLVDSGPSAKK